MVSPNGARPDQAGSVEGVNGQGITLGHQNRTVMCIEERLDACGKGPMPVWGPTLHHAAFVERDEGTVHGDDLDQARSFKVLMADRQVTDLGG